MGKTRAERPLIVEMSGESSGHCDCCGTTSRCVWGYVYRDGATVAVYWIRWTPTHMRELGADIDLVLGAWDEASAAEDRAAVSLIYRQPDDGPWSFMVVDADEARSVDGGIAGHGLRRDEVIGTPLAARVFAVVDAVIEQDRRLFG